MAEGLQITPEDLSPQLRVKSHIALCAESRTELCAPTSLPLPGAQADAPSTSSLSGLPDSFSVSLSSDLPTLAEVEAAYIAAVLRCTGGNKSQAARVLGISREGLRVKLALLPKDI